MPSLNRRGRIRYSPEEVDLIREFLDKRLQMFEFGVIRCKQICLHLNTESTRNHLKYYDNAASATRKMIADLVSMQEAAGDGE